MPTHHLISLKSARGRSYEIPLGQTVVGRPPMRGFVVRDHRVSRPHAIFERSGDSVWLTDAHSKNGVFVNSDRLQPGEKRLLRPGDAIRFWKSMKRLVLVGEGNLAAAEAQAAIGTPGADSSMPGTRDVFGFEPNVVEFAKLGAWSDAATTLAKRFQPIQVVSSGGMGRVILAQDVFSGRFLAVKVMLRNILENEHYVQQFIREGVITARLQHPNIIPVYDLGFFSDKQLYYTMRYIDGKQFDQQLRDGTLTQCLQTLRSAALAVHYAHSLGLWHRDLKPQNILVGELGDAYVIDWGLVSVQNGKEYRLELPKIVLGRKTIILPDNLMKQTENALTSAPGFMGPPAYMAPEQIAQDDSRAGAVSDVWAFGVMLFESLTGQHPLEEFKDLPGQLMPSVLAECLPAPADLTPDVPVELSALCERMLVKDPSKRMQGLSEFIATLDEFLRQGPSAERPDPAPRRPAHPYRPTAHQGPHRRPFPVSIPLQTPTVRPDANPTATPKEPTQHSSTSK